VTAHLTEEEQLEALKRWWNENGKATLVGVVLAVGGYFGWQGWQDHQRSQAESASLIYQNLVEATITTAGESLAEDKRATAAHLAGQLKSDYRGSQYAQNAALFMAKLAVEANELDKAVEELNWVLDQNPSQGIELLTRLRLARVQASQGAYDKALAILAAAEPETFAAAFAEVRGDIYLAQGKTSEARGAYQLALNSLLEQQANRRLLLQMKLDDLQQPAPTATDETTDSEGDA